MNIIICDDEEQEILQNVKRLKAIKEIAATNPIIKSYTSGRALLYDLDEGDIVPDIILLDVNMPTLEGFEVAKEIRKKGCKVEIIFITVAKERAIEAFDVDALHYIIKNETSEEKFREIIYKAMKRVERRNTEMISFTCAGEICNIPIREIRYFEVLNKIITVYYQKEEKFEFYSTLGKIENLLCKKGFIRIQRSYLVNVRNITSLTYNFVTLKDKTKLPMGRGKYTEVKEMIEKM